MHLNSSIEIAQEESVSEAQAMCLHCELPRQVPEDTLALGQRLFAPEKLYRQLGDRFDELMPREEVFGPLYAATGRKAISPLMLAIVVTFQMHERVPDREAAELVVSRIDWKYALHLPLGYTGFDYTDLHAFRERLERHGQERLVFDSLLERLLGLGLIRKRGKMRSDSTHLLGVVARLSQLELVAESLRLALLAALDSEGQWALEALPIAFQEAYNTRTSIYGLSDTQVREKLAKIGQDAFWFVGQVQAHAPKKLGCLEQVKLLEEVLSQQYPDGPEAGPLKKRPSGAKVIESPHEPQVRRGRKRDKEWNGYKLQVTESCDEDLPHLILDMQVGNALSSDSRELASIEQRLAHQGTLPSELLVDKGYMSGENIVRSQEQGIELVGIPLSDTQGPVGFKQADFSLDEETKQATCPAGVRASVWSERGSRRGKSSEILVRFPAQDCRVCSFFGRCTTSSQGRSLTLGRYRLALEQQRKLAKSDDYRKRLHERAGIEATHSEAVRCHGLRQARYRGTGKVQLQASFTATAMNLKRVTRWWAQQIRQAAKAA
jgi:transposase